MPHGGYHGVVKVGNTIVQQGSPAGAPPGQCGQYNPDGYATEMAGSPTPSTTQNIEKAIDDKKLELQILDAFQGGTTKPELYGENLVAGTSTLPAGIVPGTTFPLTGATGDTAKGLATLQNIKNQELNNLLRQQQEINLANQIKDSFATFGSDKQTADNLRKLFTGDLGDNTFLGMNLGSTEQPAATVINPYTGERITTGKIREGMTSPEYAEYMSELYDLNPALMEHIFPFGSGQIAKPIFARIGEGIMGLPGASQIGQLASSVISPLSGLFTGQSTATPQTQYDNMGNAIGIINPKASTDGGGIPQAVPEGMDMSIYGSFIGKPGPFTKDFIDQDGDGVDDRFQSGPGKPKAPPYSPPKQPAETIIPSQKLTPFDINAFYASLPQYSQQGIMNPNLMSYYRNLGLFPGMAI